MPKAIRIGLLVLVSLIFIAALSAFFGYQYWTKEIQKPLSVDAKTLFTLEKGENAHQLLKRLQKHGWIAQQWPMKLLIKSQPQLANIKAGTYEISPGMRPSELLQMLVEGREKLFAIPLIEGLRWQDWLERLRQHPHLDASTLSTESLLAQWQPEGQNLEGWLMPDTYHFRNGTKAEVIVKQAYERLQQALEASWQGRESDLPYNSPYEALIMASIIEKETAVPEERARIAAVFVNRLRKNMRLQTDPTVIYGMGEAFDGDIRSKDLKEPTPYNTYVIKGLPPTPIAMVGVASLEAALHPLQSDELYFVARNDGTHVFSTNLDDHNKAVRQYQLKR
ncbi:endolytic transglycosylase MltG [Aliiglaciecola sp. CAU 1673]|uniref:endolytic transglycosylase MltG n=1 Tax=Aliiglaciecola sp. CAU 1673 TaxID=3032595 RepID=UPI0023DA8CC5|nr:endolytic transglycosylase MltG [Aliiglaciecola sp. CAU 1673]MDF2177636.1 endolytic transglycosylase MltG [Aliiglaciecola sp. CAU 1673]